MKYKGWHFEKTALVRIGGIYPRLNTLLAVELRIPAGHATTIEKDLRVVSKPAWNRYGAELPYQLYDLRNERGMVVLSVVFRADLEPGKQNRFGFVYNNPDALPVKYPSDITFGKKEGLGFFIDALDYRLEAGSSHGLLDFVMMKMHYLEGTFPKQVVTPAVGHHGVRLMVRTDKELLELSEAYPLEGRITRMEEGPLFTRVTKICRLGAEGLTQAPADYPELETDYIFFSGQPYYTVRTRLHFGSPARICRLAHDTMTVGNRMFSHYSFRPVSKCLPPQDLEEMGHVLIDPDYTAEIPDGPLMGCLIPGDIAWHAFIRTHKGSRVSRYAYTRISLTAPDEKAPSYQSATVVEKDDARGSVRAGRYPVYVRNTGVAENALSVEAGTVWERTDLHYIRKWDEEHYANEVEKLGLEMNQRPEIEMHPVTPFSEIEKANPLGLFYGNYANAYTHPGVR